jgi:phosphomannomutase/phosphoglucomutase
MTPKKPAKVCSSAPTKLFGTAGIRGLTNIEITPLMALKISQVYADWLGNKGTVAVGHDTRYGAETLTQTSIAGLRSGGVNVVDCGCIPTGGLASHIVMNKLSGGVLVTGSHMPYNMIGIIIVMPDGAYIPEEIAHDLEKRYDEYDKRQSKVLPEKMGEYKKADNPLVSYKKFLLGIADNDLIREKKFKVLVDPANGTAGLVLPELLRELGCEVYVINEKIKPIPDRPAEPRAINLKETAGKVKEYKCNLGIATDIDADRVLFIDEKGEVISEDLMGSIFAKSVMDKHKETDRLCVTPINSSGLIEYTCDKSKIKLEYCPVGQPATLKVVKHLKANFSYEESGKYYFADQAIWADGLLSALILLEIMAKTNKSLSQLASEFPKFYQVKHTVHCEHDVMDKVMKKVFELWKKQAIEGKVKDITVDGLKRVYKDNSWLLIRASGTEPLIRVYADAMSLNRAEELVKWGEEIVKKALL